MPVNLVPLAIILTGFVLGVCALTLTLLWKPGDQTGAPRPARRAAERRDEA